MSKKRKKQAKTSLSPRCVRYHPPGPIFLPNNAKQNITQGPQKSSPANEGEQHLTNNIKQSQDPSARAAHHRGQNAYVVPAKAAAALTRPADASLPKRRPTTASFSVGPQITPAVPAPQAPTEALDEPATATRPSPATTSSAAAGKKVRGAGTVGRASIPGTSVEGPASSGLCGVTPLVTTPPYT